MIDNTNNVECKFIDLSKDSPEYDIIDKFIFSTVGKILTKMVDVHPFFKGTQDNGYTLRKIFGGTTLHVDGVHSKTSGFTKFVRCLSIIIVLNDDYDGGVFCFPKQGLKFRVQKGQAIMIPPYWTHPHSVTSVGEGQSRYTINTWILEKFID
jgi:dTDP-4-dehydrorhamnose 3,5-epimerase-like enzyme